MKLYAKLMDDEIVLLFSSPQPEETCPGIQEIESDDPRVAEFIESNKIRGFDLE